MLLIFKIITIMEYNYSKLDDYDLQLEIKSLDEGMKTFTDDSKITYSEAWKQRKRKHKALTEEINKRK